MTIELSHIKIDPHIKAALAEDITTVDVSTQAIFRSQERASVELLAKQDGFLAGLPVFQRVFELLSPEADLSFNWLKHEGDRIAAGDKICLLKGPVESLLTGERLALNYLQRMSGIATATRSLAQALAKGGVKILDTRKTTPGFRLFEKYAVRVGGGFNHRYNLSDLIMLKDNHIAAAGGVRAAIQRARRYDPFILKIEVECENLDMVLEAVQAGADIIMLDNFDFDEIEAALAIIDGQAIVECSGNINQDNIHRYADLAIDYISSGAIIHSAGILDLSMKNLTVKDDYIKRL